MQEARDKEMQNKEALIAELQAGKAAALEMVEEEKATNRRLQSALESYHGDLQACFIGQSAQ